MNDAPEERLLRADLKVRALPPDAMARVRLATEAEWRAQVGASRRRWMPAASAAAVLLALVGAWVLWGSLSAPAGAAVARVARTEAAGVVQFKSWGREAALGVGSPLESGSSYSVRGATLLTLEGGGNLRIARDSRFEVLAANAIRLDSGEIYVDIPPGARTGASFVAITSAGEFRHVGTQFSLSVADGGTRLRVREGSVHWHAADGDATVAAGSEVLIDRLHRVTRALIGVNGAQWTWTETLAPEIDIENRPVSDFLGWFARETGRQLVVTDAATLRQVNSIQMHGNVRGLEPDQALAAVLGSTSLRFQVSGDAIRVSSPGEPAPKSQ